MLALYYMLAGQEGLASAIPLRRDSRGFHTMALRPSAGSGTYRVSVAYDVAVQRHVETSVTLHSGIQVSQLFNPRHLQQKPLHRSVLISELFSMPEALWVPTHCHRS